MKLIEVVQNHEKSENAGVKAIENELVVFGDESEFDIPQEERKLLDQKLLKRIAEYVYNDFELENQGFPNCIKLYGNYIFVGFSQGIIRIFDMKTNEELRSLFPKKKKGFASRVSWIDISLAGDQWVAGYAWGKICVFDIFKQKTIIEIDEVYKTEIEYVKFLSKLSANHFIAADKRGFIQRLIVTK